LTINVGITMAEITITERAQAHFRKLLSTQAADTNIRLFVVNEGTANAECGVSYCPQDAVSNADEEIQYDGFKAYMDKQSLPYLDEAIIDYDDDGQTPQLTLKAPNAKMLRVDDDSPLEDRVNYVIQTKINPQLASHGGFLSLVSVKDGVASVRFGGGCNGCSLAAVTLDDGVKTELLSSFPGELTEVLDGTEHEKGEHSYYE